jgi:hypothetical protein
LTRFVLKNPLLDFRVLRCRRERTLRGVDLAECIATARRIRPAEISSWHSGWVRTTEDAAHLAEGAEQAGEGATARLGYLRASSYYRTAGVMLLSLPLPQTTDPPRLHRIPAALAK